MSYLNRYISRLKPLLDSLDARAFEDALSLLRDVTSTAGKVVLAGNGGSAAMASHVAVDLTKVAGIRAITFNDADLITCFANDFGYERWLEKAMEAYVDDRDTVVLISSSGQSPNIVNAAKQVLVSGAKLLTLSGFAPENPLRLAGKVNLWVDCSNYNLVEITHQTWLLAMVDALAGTALDE
jgi:D-sedoheptulose 7-phosphate isomerase